ncbi:MAG: alpha-L-arabinofuranosidase C-terminal domain-containing protein [Bryobacteraceae bacterium]|nr:alpha-L-arabinofuranosidase C-terminal domain-containing protein [Bryobacteraceae bacterium]
MFRRHLLKAPLALLPALRGQSAESRIEILTGEVIGRIAPEIYGHFVEHLGGVVYDGIWVGENSKIANTGGIRTAIVEALKQVKPGVIRWPGGCFADSYNWRDGVGPYNTRPRRANFWLDAREWPAGAPDGPWKYDPNRFGTLEFLRFCQLTGGQPYLAANLRSQTARDFYEWVDYVNSPAGSTTMAELRASHGQKDPHRVRYWGVGNESWGCGGNFAPEEYVVEYRRFAEWVPRFGMDLAFVGSGPNGGDLGWTRRFFGKLAEKGGFGRLWGWGLHHYSWNVTGGRTSDWIEGKGAALGYPEVEWYELLADADKMESLITGHWTVMGEFDRQHRVKLVVDEWGSWYKPGSESHPSHLLGQQSTMRDAVLAGMTLDTFHRHADKVAMANIAQLVNCLQALFLAHEDRFALTPTYHVFDLYAEHQGAQSLRTLVSAPAARFDRGGNPVALRGLSASASMSGKRLLLTVTNPDRRAARETEIALRGVSIRGVRARVLESGGDRDAHNSLADPDRVSLKQAAVDAPRGGLLVHRFPPASVTGIEFDLS